MRYELREWDGHDNKLTWCIWIVNDTLTQMRFLKGSWDNHKILDGEWRDYQPALTYTKVTYLERREVFLKCL